MAEFEKEFVVTLTRHLILGWLLVPYWARKKSDEIIEIEEIADTESVLSAQESDIEKDIIRIYSMYTDKYLMSVYSKEKTVADFYKKIQDKQLKTVIRPYVEKKQRVILELVRLHQIPLYLRDPGQKEMFPHNRITIEKSNVEVGFQVNITDEIFRYSVFCRQADKEFSLLNKTPVVLVADPAYIVLDRKLYLFEKIEAARLLPFFSKSYVEIPDTLRQKYIKSVVLPAVERFPVTGSGLQVVDDRVSPFAELSLERTLDDRPALSLEFRYGNKTFSPTKKLFVKYAYLVNETVPVIIHTICRDSLWEQACIQQLLDLGLKRTGDKLFNIPDYSEKNTLLDWVNANRLALSDKFVLLQTDLSKIYYIGNISLIHMVENTPDWFDVKIMVRIGPYEFPFIRFKRHIINGVREFVLPDHRIALLPSEWFTDYKELFLLGVEKEERIRLKKIHYTLLEQWWKNRNIRKKDLKALLEAYEVYAPVKVPCSLKTTLRKYQQDGFSWMVRLAENKFGGCLADDMGLGKTVQTIALLQYNYQCADSNNLNRILPNKSEIYPMDRFGQTSLFGDSIDLDETVIPHISRHSERDSQPASLIVVPTSLLHNWKREIRKFSSLTVYEYSGTGRFRTKNIGNVFKHYNIVLTTYGVLRNDIEFFATYVFGYVILDESQYIKNPDSVIYNTVMMLRSNHRMVLTGTPIENSLKDLWTQFNFINPGLLGTKENFRNNYIIPITKSENNQTKERLKQLIHPFFLRRTKEQVATELPALTEKVLICEMSSSQETAYKKEKNRIRNALLSFSEEKKLKKNTFIALQGMTRLRLLANHPRIVQPDYSGSSGKLEEILNCYETLVSGGHKVLIFSSFVKHLNILAGIFDEKGWKYAMLTGQTQDREAEITRFTSDNTLSCFFISLKAGGVGLNLTDADYVFIIDPWWNPASEMQAVSRAHRIGQKKQVIVYRFISSGTIEEKIMKLQEQKSDLAETFIANNNPFAGLSTKEIESLFE